jgi:uncharacterized repeat protein (TIGR03803 family)
MASTAHSRWIWRTTLASIFLLSSVVVPTRAQTFTVLHAFHSGKGPQGPSGVLTLDQEGNLYGVAGGGTGTCFASNPCGTVYKMGKAGELIWVYSFKGPGTNGNGPTTGLLRDAKGNLFGVTEYGGINTKACDDNVQRICGVVFKLDSTGKKETVLHRFSGGLYGMVPEALLTEDSSGNLYGTTIWGGSPKNSGVVFKLDQAGRRYKVLYRFWGGRDAAGLIRGPAGYLYGIDDVGSYGGPGFFQVDISTAKLSFLGSYGLLMDSVLLRDEAGNLYGTDSRGGQNYSGTIGKLTYASGTWSSTVLYTFCPQLYVCSDGQYPTIGPLVHDAAGNLYGTTISGGEKGSNCNGGTCGVVFKLDTSGTETVLHTFTGGSDGAFPDGGLVMDAAGKLYGTTGQGGDLNCAFNGIKGCGVVFKITP